MPKFWIQHEYYYLGDYDNSDMGYKLRTESGKADRQ